MVRLLAVMLLLAGAPALASERDAPAVNPKAQAHKQAALDEFAAKRYERAAIEFRAAYAIDPRPEFLFGSAQAERLRGNCGAAAPDYRAFLNTVPPQEHVPIARFHLDQCERILASMTHAPSPQEVTPANASPQPDATNMDKRAFYKDPVGGVLCGAGAAAMLTGTILIVVGSSRMDEAQRNYTAWISREGETERTLGLVTLGVGAGLAIAGTVRYFLVSRRDGSSSRAFVAPQPSGAALVFAGDF